MLNKTLKLDWQEKLFDLAVQYGCLQALKDIILERCVNLLALKQLNSDDDFEKLCKFWFFRAFYFLNIEESATYW